MFTGLVAEVGRLSEAPRPSPTGGVLLVLDHSARLAERLEIGASLAVSGVCLTIVELSPEGSMVELSPETLRRTTLGDLAAGDGVNLEPALRLGDPLGGHWVQGHVDGTGRVIARRDLDEHAEVAFSLSNDLAPYLVEKGSITVDGVSLTVVEPLDDGFTVAVIPHTAVATTLGERRAGDLVNLEADVMAKYAERLLAAHLADTQGGGPAADRTLERSTT